MTKTTVSDSNELPDYDRPPVVEVVIGLTFQPLRTLRVAHYGVIWESIRDEFPITEQAPPLGIEESVDSLPIGAWLFLPRAWFLNSARDQLIQFQHDRLYVNWRSHYDNKPYPHYDAIVGLFEEKSKKIGDILRAESIGEMVPKQYELKYVNHIPQGTAWKTFQDLPDVFPDFCWRAPKKRFLPAAIAGTWSAVFPMPDGAGNLIARMQPGTRVVEDEKQEIITLEMVAQGPKMTSEAMSARVWFDLAHEWIVKGFADITSESVQRDVWGKKYGSC